MADLATSLKQFIDAPATRTAAAGAPLLLAAGAASAIIGAAVSTPGWAAAGLGMVLTSLATNITSSLAYDLLTPELPADERERLVARGLRQRDPAVIRMVAEALVAAGPALADALPAGLRAELAAALGEGMAEPGGALAAIALQYAAGLGSASTDWAALGGELRATLARVSLSMEASSGGVISGSPQSAPHAGGEINLSMRAVGPGSRIENSPQTVTGGANSSSPSPTPLGTRAHTEQLLAISRQRLQLLEERAAREGLHTPPEVVIEIEMLRADIAALERRLGE